MTRLLRDDRGQTLFLAPIGLIIVLILGMATLEVGAMHLHQRQLDDLADSIANDAATVGFDTDAFRTSGEIRIDATLANSVAGPAIAISNLDSATAAPMTVVDGPEPEVTVVLTYEHEHIFAAQIFSPSTTLTATGTAALVGSG